MKQSLYSIYDTVAELFNKPFTEINDATAMRAFTEMASKQPHKNDYALYKLADFIDHNGEIAPCEPQKIMTGFDVQLAEVTDINQA
jgi:hypothetical protein